MENNIKLCILIGEKLFGLVRIVNLMLIKLSFNLIRFYYVCCIVNFKVCIFVCFSLWKLELEYLEEVL